MGSAASLGMPKTVVQVPAAFPETRGLNLSLWDLQQVAQTSAHELSPMLVIIGLFCILTIILFLIKTYTHNPSTAFPWWWNNTSEQLLTQPASKYLHTGRGKRTKSCKQAPSLEVFCWSALGKTTMPLERAMGTTEVFETATGGIFSHMKQLQWPLLNSHDRKLTAKLETSLTAWAPQSSNKRNAIARVTAGTGLWGTSKVY